MTLPSKFTKAQERAIHDVGKKIEMARSAKRLTVRSAADRTITSSHSGHMTEATWRRVEKGYTQTRLGNIIYRPSPATLMAMAEVVDLDGAELCKELGLVPPPPISQRQSRSEFDEIREEFRRLGERLDHLARRR